ncbi:hypothetical protein [Massilia phyllosphaerae]|uniref:hypothetical protein n=1 Tax=Massilia phyllosphaerae TaxID=3106034 RepID=UPI002B1CAC97|nr:hypothetical protein [Massilia sp. SGZ-792]
MNRKIALLMFVIGLGAASAPVLADSCAAHCQNAKNWCLNNTADRDACMATFSACMEECYG